MSCSKFTKEMLSTFKGEKIEHVNSVLEGAMEALSTFMIFMIKKLNKEKAKHKRLPMPLQKW